MTSPAQRYAASDSGPIRILFPFAFPRLFRLVLLLIALISASPAASQTARDREIAGAFAPVIYQALGDKPRSDYITNFDFDGDWRGDNNWKRAEDQKFPLKAYVYYSVAETATHFFIHYAMFHPRDYKGGERKGLILSELIREGVKHGGKHDSTGLLDEAGVAHENDLEGCLVVVEKKGSELSRGRVVYVETLHHSEFSRYLPTETGSKGFGVFRLDAGRVLLYSEPKGHGIEAYLGDDKQTAKKAFLIYKFTGKAENPEQQQDGSVGYDLVPIQTSLWANAVKPLTQGSNLTYGKTHDYGLITISLAQPGGEAVARNIKLGRIGSAFLGNTGGLNMARPPWAWFDKTERERPLGLWFFDPATVIKRDFQMDASFSTAYVRLPFWAVGR